MSAEAARYGTWVPWVDVLMSPIAAVSWALIGMAGTAALGLRLLEADAAGALGPMTASVVALGAGGAVTPSGDVSVLGLEGAEATTAIEIAPWGVSLVGAPFVVVLPTVVAGRRSCRLPRRTRRPRGGGGRAVRGGAGRAGLGGARRHHPGRGRAGTRRPARRL